MLSGVYSAATALKTAEYQQDVIATNLAHMNVPGFRKSNLSVEAFAQQLDAQNANDPGHGQTIESLNVDFSPGAMQRTGRKLDVAINGDGFFAVQGENETLYTRSGSLLMDQNGQLVGHHGFPILGDGGPITMPPETSTEEIYIASDGSIAAGGVPVGKLQLVQFDDNALLQPVGTTLFSAKDANPNGEQVTVVQGVREASNVSPVDELVAMILAARYHEAAQRTLKTINDAIHQQTDSRG